MLHVNSQDVYYVFCGVATASESCAILDTSRPESEGLVKNLPPQRWSIGKCLRVRKRCKIAYKIDVRKRCPRLHSEFR